MEHLVLKNFGPISDIDINLKKINIFIGEQGVGKSTIAKLLTCLRNLYLQDAIFEKNDERIMSVFSKYGLEGMFSGKTAIIYSNNRSNITITYSDGKFDIFPLISDGNDLKAIIKMQLTLRLFGAASSGIDMNNFNVEETKEYAAKNWRTILASMNTSLYCPAERGFLATLSNSLATLVLNSIPISDILMEYMSFFEKARHYFKTYKVDFLNLDYTIKNSEDFIEFEGKTIPLKLASSGIQSILPLMMVMDYCMKEKSFSSFTIEEPELNLFPCNQMGLLRFILSRTIGKDSLVESWTLTTHSPYILSIMNISLLAGKIIDKYPESRPQVEEMIARDHIVMPNEISVFALKNGDVGCENLIDAETGLISANYLDTVSDVLSTEFNRLNKLYLNYIRKSL